VVAVTDPTTTANERPPVYWVLVVLGFAVEISGLRRRRLVRTPEGAVSSPSNSRWPRVVVSQTPRSARFRHQASSGKGFAIQ
jgi:hypothetical protein